jgi:putative PIN family toxin of toxin-antitoxin system
MDYSSTRDMKLVLDTDVIVAGLRSPSGASAELLRLARHREVSLAVSVPLLLEYEAVSTRPEHLMASGLLESEVQAVIDVLVSVAEWVRIDYRWRPQTRDPADEMVLEAAINAQADAIVTFNRRDFGKAPARFAIGCWLPAETLEKLR